MIPCRVPALKMMVKETSLHPELSPMIVQKSQRKMPKRNVE
jgi:hypothetical protein